MGFELLEHEPFSALLHYRIEAQPVVELLM